MSTIERRRSPRYPARIPVQVKTENGTLNGTSVNLSISGACAVVEGEAKEFSTIELLLAVDLDVNGSLETFKVNFPGVIVRAESTEDRTVIAVMFQKVPVESEWALSKYLLERFSD